MHSEVQKFLHEDYDDHDEVKKQLDELLRNLTSLKARVSSLEDRAKIIIVNVDAKANAERGATLQSEIDAMREKLKKLEEEL